MREAALIFHDPNNSIESVSFHSSIILLLMKMKWGRVTCHITYDNLALWLAGK